MKPLIFPISIIILLVIPVESAASSEKEFQTQAQTTQSVEVLILLDGLNKFKSVDQRNVKLLERKALRKEMQNVTAQAKESGGDGEIFISLAPSLVVILLLIILL